ncbi:MAG: Gfo/Idh/MocA family oxidoreductase [Chloroflexi bacterium]|nr:Gfo/Idh/MocA family oxidoreductase [Chloroflexota bacterium]
MKKYRAAVIGCSRMGAFIDNEVIGYPNIVLPYSHASGFMACDRIDLVACADVRADVMEEFGKQYHVPKERQYTDYRDMIAKEKLDIASVATQPEQRAEIVIYAVDHGVKAIYAEKAMAASMTEADAMVAAVERNGAILNLGTNRRWNPRYDKMKEIIDSGELGPLKSLIIYNNDTLFNSSSHTFDLILRLNSDHAAEWVQAYLPNDEGLFDGDLLRKDPLAQGTIQFDNGVTAYALLTPRKGEWEAICEKGSLTAYSDGYELQLRYNAPLVEGKPWMGSKAGAFPPVTHASSTLRLVEDLVHSLDTGEPPRGGVRVARASTELLFAFIESHRRGGCRVSLPLQDSKLQLQRNRNPNQPKYAPV